MEDEEQSLGGGWLEEGTGTAPSNHSGTTPDPQVHPSGHSYLEFCEQKGSCEIPPSLNPQLAQSRHAAAELSQKNIKK